MAVFALNGMDVSVAQPSIAQDSKKILQYEPKGRIRCTGKLARDGMRAYIGWTGDAGDAGRREGAPFEDWDGGRIDIWDVQKQAILTSLTHEGTGLIVYDRHFLHLASYDRLLTFTKNGKMNVWDLSSRKIMRAIDLSEDLDGDHHEVEVLWTPRADMLFTFAANLRCFEPKVLKPLLTRQADELEVLRPSPHPPSLLPSLPYRILARRVNPKQFYDTCLGSLPHTACHSTRDLALPLSLMILQTPSWAISGARTCERSSGAFAEGRACLMSLESSCSVRCHGSTASEGSWRVSLMPQDACC